MRFMIVSSQAAIYPDASPAGTMRVLDFIEAPSASEAIEVFKEDNLQYADSKSTEFLCVPLSDESIIRFNSVLDEKE